MIPQKCIDKKCPRKGLDSYGNDVCILGQVREKKENAVVDVFSVSEKTCKKLRAIAEEKIRKQEERRFGEIKEIAIKPIKGEGGAE